MSSDEKDKSAEADKGAAAKGDAAESESEGGLLPAILVGAGLLAVVALVLFGGDDSDEKERDKPAAAARAQAGAAERPNAPGGADGPGGVPSRPIDEPARPSPAVSPRINPAVKLPAAGMAPQGVPTKDDKPPEGASEEELIAWYEKKLEVAKRMLEQRRKFKDRLPQIQERIEGSNTPDREKQLEAFEGRKKIVEENFESAQKKVEEYEKTLAELRGS